jgi:methionyl aminopeptidase
MVETRVKNQQEIADMREAGRIHTLVLDELVAKTKAGVTPKQLDELAASLVKKNNAEPAFLGHRVGSLQFPATLCVSVNNEIVHGIPGDKPFREGDLVGLDFGVRYNGMITDAARTVSVGKPSPSAKKLLEGCYNALQAALDALKDGVVVGDISASIEEQLNHAGVKAIYSLVGHGVGRELWEDPAIPNYGKAGTGPALKAGMTVAIEPIASLGTHDLYLADDGWTYMTRDGSLAAQFENTVLITKDGCGVLAS